MIQPNFIAAYLIDPNAKPEPLILLLRRAQNTYLSGIWQIVTGKVEKNQNESIPQTLRREILEETGLKIEEAYNVNITLFYEKVKDQVGFSANFAAFLDHKQTIKISPREHSEYCWYSIKEACKLLAFSSQKETLLHIEEYYLKQTADNASLILL